MKFQKVRHKTAVAKLQKDDEAEEAAEIEIESAIAMIEINLSAIKSSSQKGYKVVN